MSNLPSRKASEAASTGGERVLAEDRLEVILRDQGDIITPAYVDFTKDKRLIEEAARSSHMEPDSAE